MNTNAATDIRFYSIATGILGTGIIRLADGSEALAQVQRQGGAWVSTIEGSRIAKQPARHATKNAAKEAVREALRAAQGS